MRILFVSMFLKLLTRNATCTTWIKSVPSSSFAVSLVNLSRMIDTNKLPSTALAIRK